MRRAFSGISLWLVAVVATPAQHFDTPADLVETLYQSYFSDVSIDDFGPYFSEGLTRQIDGKVAVSAFAALGFDPIVGDSNWQPRNFRVLSVHETGDKAQVNVSFTTRSLPVSITLDLVNEPADGWQIDHISGTAGERNWCTNDIISLHQGTQGP